MHLQNTTQSWACHSPDVHWHGDISHCDTQLILSHSINHKSISDSPHGSFSHSLQAACDNHRRRRPCKPEHYRRTGDCNQPNQKWDFSWRAFVGEVSNDSYIMSQYINEVNIRCMTYENWLAAHRRMLRAGSPSMFVLIGVRTLNSLSSILRTHIDHQVDEGDLSEWPELEVWPSRVNQSELESSQQWLITMPYIKTPYPLSAQAPLSKKSDIPRKSQQKQQ